MATVLQVDLRRDICSAYFDEDFPFLLQGRVDPTHYASTIQEATRRFTSYNWVVYFFLLYIIVVSALIPVSVIYFGGVGLWVMCGMVGLELLGIILLVVAVRRARVAVENFLCQENTSYYNQLGINFKFHQQYRHVWIAVEIMQAQHHHHQQQQPPPYYHHQAPPPQHIVEIYQQEQPQYPVTAPLMQYQPQQPYYPPPVIYGTDPQPNPYSKNI